MRRPPPPGRRLSPTARQVTATVVLAALAIGAGLAAALLPEWAPPARILRALLLGVFALRVPGSVVVGTVAVLIGAVLSAFQAPGFEPGMVLVLIAATGIAVGFVRSRDRLGLQGSAGDLMIVDLRDRLSAHGRIPQLPAGWRVDTELRPAFAAVLAHGYSGTGPTMKRYARLFRERFSCDILTPDLRGHGRSEGGYIGFGLRDAEDLRLWIDRVAVLRGSELPVVLFGVSMGGAAVLGAAGTDLPPNVACAVSDCAFSDARAILAYKARRLYHIPAFPAVDALRTAPALLARYDLAEASPRRSAARAAVPLLLIHGEADTFVPPSMARELYDAAPRGRAELYLVPEAGHAEAYRTAGGAYADRVETFVRASLAGC